MKTRMINPATSPTAGGKVYPKLNDHIQNKYQVITHNE